MQQEQSIKKRIVKVSQTEMVKIGIGAAKMMKKISGAETPLEDAP